MNNWLINVSDLPAEGRDFSFTDPAFWVERSAEHGLSVVPVRPLTAEVNVSAQPDGALIRGRLQGAVKLCCDRCVEEYDFLVDTVFDLLETLPEGDEPEQDSRLYKEKGEILLDMGALLWEEFVLTLPIKPLCDNACKGICPECGQNLNSATCTCSQDKGDPRLAVFRNLKLK